LRSERDLSLKIKQNFIHRLVPGEPIYDLFAAWKKATLEIGPMQVWGMRQWFTASAQNLATRGYKVNLQRKWLSKGWLIWQLDNLSR
jgi:hypothetical protein